MRVMHAKSKTSPYNRILTFQLAIWLATCSWLSNAIMLCYRCVVTANVPTMVASKGKEVKESRSRAPRSKAKNTELPNVGETGAFSQHRADNSGGCEPLETKVESKRTDATYRDREAS